MVCIELPTVIAMLVLNDHTSALNSPSTVLISGSMTACVVAHHCHTIIL